MLFLLFLLLNRRIKAEIANVFSLDIWYALLAPDGFRMPLVAGEVVFGRLGFAAHEVAHRFDLFERLLLRGGALCEHGGGHFGFVDQVKDQGLLQSHWAVLPIKEQCGLFLLGSRDVLDGVLKLVD